MTRRARAAAAVLSGAALLTVPGCVDAQQSCTAIGCDSQVTFELPVDLVAETPYDVRACVDEVCRSATLTVPAPDDGPYTGTTANDLTLVVDADAITLALPVDDWGGQHRTSIVVRGPAGDVITEAEADREFTAARPNGPDCPPVCWQATVVV